MESGGAVATLHNLVKVDVLENDASAGRQGRRQENEVLPHRHSFSKGQRVRGQIILPEGTAADASADITLTDDCFLGQEDSFLEKATPRIAFNASAETPHDDDIGPGLVQIGGQFFQRSRCEAVIRVQEHEILPFCSHHPGVSRSGHTGILLPDKLNGRHGPEHLIGSPVLGAVVNDYSLERAFRNAGKRPADERDGIISRYDYSEAHGSDFTRWLPLMQLSGSLLRTYSRIRPSTRLS